MNVTTTVLADTNGN